MPGSGARAPAASALLIAGTIAAGLALRLLPLGLPDVVVKYGGSILWALMVRAIVGMLRPRWSPARVAVAAAVVAALVEGSQAWRQPALDAFRATPPGALLLGRVFAVRDLLAYAAGIAIGTAADILTRRPDRRRRSRARRCPDRRARRAVDRRR